MLPWGLRPLISPTKDYFLEYSFHKELTRVNKKSQYLEWIRLKKNGLASLVFKRYTVLYVSTAYCSVWMYAADSKEQQSILMPKFSWAWLSSKPFWYRKQNKRLIVEKDFLIRKAKQLWVSNCHWTAVIKVLQKNYFLRLKRGYRCCCHMQWQLGSGGSYHEKDVAVHLTWEIYSPHKRYN